MRRTMRNPTRSESGFTLIELLCVVAILGSLAASAGMAVIDLQSIARTTAVKHNGEVVRQSLEGAILMHRLRGTNPVVMSGGVNVAVNTTTTTEWGYDAPAGTPTMDGAHALLKCGGTPPALYSSGPCAGIPGYQIYLADSFAMIFPDDRPVTDFSRQCYFMWSTGFSTTHLTYGYMLDGC